MSRWWATAAAVCAACSSSPASIPRTMTNATGPDAAPPTTTTTTTATAWPATRREPVTDTLHGVAVADPYRWLENARDPAVAAWIDAQDRYAQAELAKLPALAPATEMLRAIYHHDVTEEPVHRKGRFFYPRRHADRDKRVIYWKTGETGAERVLLDPNTWPAARALAGFWPSPDGKLVAYTTREADEQVMHVIDVDAGTERPDAIANLKWASASWAPDSRGFYYRWVPPPGAVPETERRGAAELRFHALGTDPARDPVMYPATGNTGAHLDGFVSDDGRWLFATLEHGWTSTEIHYRDLRAKKARWQTLVKGVDARFVVLPWRDRFFVHTNDGAPRYRVMKVDPARPARAAWKELVPQHEQATLERVNLVGGKLALTYLRDASTEIAIHDLAGKKLRMVDLPPLGASPGISGDPDEDTGYLTYTSFTEPGVVSKISMRTGALTELARIKLPVDTSAYVSERVWYPSRDGTKVSMFIVRKRDVQPTGTNPTILWGYGGFGESMTPMFWFARVPWLEAGGVFAVANLRGGGEYGEAWHRAGMAANKQKTIDDLRAAAHYLVDSGWTASAHLGLLGASNGGLVVCAAMTQEPALARAVVAIVPLTDMIRYARFGHASAWVPEYGSADDAAQFAALHAYSPYHHVVPGTAYPALLVQGAEQDDRVDPLHARKFIAAVQGATSSGRPVLLHLLRGSGHLSTDSTKEQVQKNAVIHAFLSAQLR